MIKKINNSIALLRRRKTKNTTNKKNLNILNRISSDSETKLKVDEKKNPFSDPILYFKTLIIILSLCCHCS